MLTTRALEHERVFTVRILLCAGSAVLVPLWRFHIPTRRSLPPLSCSHTSLAFRASCLVPVTLVVLLKFRDNPNSSNQFALIRAKQPCHDEHVSTWLGKTINLRTSHNQRAMPISVSQHEHRIC